MSALIALAAGLLLLAWERASPDGSARSRQWAALAAVGVALAFAVLAPPRGGPDGPLVFDAYGTFFCVVVLIVGGLTLVTVQETFERLERSTAGVYPLVLFTLFGAMLAGMAGDLLLLAAALECSAACARRLVGKPWLKHPDAIAGGLLVAGALAVLVGGGSTSLSALAQGALSEQNLAGQAPSGLLLAGFALTVAGLAARAAAAPFHLTSVDFVADAPAPIGGLIAAAVRAAGLIALGRVLLTLPTLAASLAPALWGLAALTLLACSAGAAAQTDLRRLLAYGASANGGFVLMALAAVDAGGVAANPRLSGVLFYLLAHAFMIVGVTAGLAALARDGAHRTTLRDLAGLGRERPWLAAGLSVCLLSLAGAPLTMGFIGRLYLFAAAVDGGQYGLVAAGAAAAVVGAGCYLRPITWLYLRHGAASEPPEVSASWSSLAAACLFLLLFGALPNELISRCLSGLLSL